MGYIYYFMRYSTIIMFKNVRETTVYVESNLILAPMLLDLRSITG